MFLDLAKATALILALGLLQGFNLRLLHGHPRISRWVAGALFGSMCVFGMLMPITLADGVFFDARSVVLGIAALYGGPLVGVIAGVIAGAWRIHLGGAGVTVGLAVVVASVVLGLLYRQGVRRQGWSRQAVPLLMFGVVLHLVALVLFTQLPQSYVAAVFSELALPYLAILAPATVLLGIVLNAIEERQSTERELAASKARLQAIAAASPDIHLVIDEEGRILEVSAPEPDQLYAQPDELRGRRLHQIYPAQQAETFLQFVTDTLQHTDPQRIEYTLETKRGWRTFEARGRAIDVPLQGRKAVVVVARDITERLLAEAELRIAAQAFEAQQGMIITDAATRILRVNRAFTRITGYAASDVVGRDARVLASGHHDQAFYEGIWHALHLHDGWQGEVWNRRKNGALYPARITVTAVRDLASAITHYVEAIEDLTETKQAEREIHSLAFFDHLTALPNRRLLTERLEAVLAASRQTGEEGALLFIDLDDFKNVNDLHNHHNGDLLLQQVAQRLRSLVEPDHTAARFGADEFVILLDHLPTDPAGATVRVEVMGEAILESLNRPFMLENRQHRQITASIGVVLFNGDDDQAEDVLLQADLAMHEAKRRGKNRLHFFDPAMQEQVTSRLHLEDAIRTGIDQQQFIVHFQPQVNAAGRVTGAEALARWPDAPAGAASPGVFIAAAERAGLMPALGRLLLDQVCTHIAAWQADPVLRSIRVAVNLSVTQIFQPDFVPSLLAALRRTGAPGDCLTLEITESLLLNDLDDAQAILSALRTHGVRFSIDDFGTGYSSLAYLQRLPLSELKIDQSFVRDIAENPSNQAIVQTILALASALRLDVVAEGVESRAQMLALQQRGCTQFQGYWYARPMPPTDFTDWVHQRSQSDSSDGTSSRSPDHTAS